MRLARALVELYRRQGRHNLADHLLDSWIEDHPEREEFREWQSKAPPP